MQIFVSRSHEGEGEDTWQSRGCTFNPVQRNPYVCGRQFKLHEPYHCHHFEQHRDATVRLYEWP